MKAFVYIVLLSLLLSPQLFADDEATELSMFERIVQNNLGRDVAFNFKMRMLGMTGIRLENFRISENKNYLNEYPYLNPWAFSAVSVDVRYNPLAFFIGRISLKEVSVQDPQVQVAINSHLQHNFEDIVKKQQANRFSNWIRAHHIDIENMHFNIYSELMFAQPIKYEVADIDVDIKNLIKGQIASIDIAAKSPGASVQNIDIRGTIGPVISIGRVEESPMNLQIRMKNAPLEFELAKVPESIFKDKRYRRSLALPESGFANITYDFKGDVWKNLEVLGLVELDNIVMASIDKSLKGKPFDIRVVSETSISLNKQDSDIKNFYLDINKSRITLQGQMTQIIDNPQVDLHLFSNTIRLKELNDIYPFISDIYQIAIVNGITTMDLKASGNMQKGLQLDGSLHTKNLQLASLNSELKGKTLDTGITLKQPIMYYASKNQITFDNISTDIANSTIKLSGRIDDVSSIDRTIHANIESQNMDVTAMHEFFPFVNELLPEELSYQGFFSFTSKATGNLYQGDIEGKIDFRPLTFRIKNFARKPGKSRFDLDYSASFNEESEIELLISFVFDKGQLDNSVVYMDAMRHLFGNKLSGAKAQAYLESIDPDAIGFSQASGKLSMSRLDTLDIKVHLEGIHNSQQQGVDFNFQGSIDRESYHLKIKAAIHIPKASYLEIVAINPDARRYINEDASYLILPLIIEGHMSKPAFKPAG